MVKPRKKPKVTRCWATRPTKLSPRYETWYSEAQAREQHDTYGGSYGRAVLVEIHEVRLSRTVKTKRKATP